MAIPSSIESLSTTAASNGPSGSDDRSTADDGLRAAYAFIRQLVTQGSDIASASTITPPSTGSVFDITGTTSITTIASTNSWDGRVIALQFDGILTLTHSSNLYLPGAANITTAAGDIAFFIQRGTGAWQLTNYLVKADNRVVQGTFAVNGNATLGNATTDAHTINGATTLNGAAGGIGLTVETATYSPNAIKIAATTTTARTFGFGIDINSGLQCYDNTAGSSRWYVPSTGGFVILAPTSGYSLNLPSGAPASAGANGNAGDIAWDSGYVYVCVSSNTWKRATLATW